MISTNEPVDRLCFDELVDQEINIQKGGLMTRNQIDYYNAREGKRHNIATEKETNRSNVARESETNRHNVVTEVETNRHNVAGETEINRHNRANEIEDHRHNTQTEFITRDQNLWQRTFSQLENDRNYRINKERNALTGRQITNQEYMSRTNARSVTGNLAHLSRQDQLAAETLAFNKRIGEENVNVAYMNANSAAMNAQTNAINAETSRARVTQQNLYDQGMLRNNTLTAQSQVDYQRNKMRVENQQVVIGYLNAGANLLRSSSDLARSLKGVKSNGQTETKQQTLSPQEQWWNQLEELIEQERAQ